MNKNMILLIGIIAIFLLIIRPVNNDSSVTNLGSSINTDDTTVNEDYEEDLEVTQKGNNKYVEQSKKNNENTETAEKKQYTK